MALSLAELRPRCRAVLQSIFLAFRPAAIKKPHSGYSTIFHEFAAAMEKGSIRSAAFFIGMDISHRLLIEGPGCYGGFHSSPRAWGSQIGGSKAAHFEPCWGNL